MTPKNLLNVSGECDLLDSVSSQQRFEVTDVKALGASLLSDSLCYSSWTDQFYLENEGKYILEVWGHANPKDTKRRERERERERVRVLTGERKRDTQPCGSSFLCFSPPPGPALCKLGLLGVLFVLPEVLTPVLQDDPADVSNLISGSSTFSKSSLNIWKFSVHVLLKPDLENFEHYFSSVWDECNCAVVRAFSGIAFLWDWNENWPFPVLWPLLSLPNLLAYLLSAALSQHHLLWFETAQLEFHHPH